MTAVKTAPKGLQSKLLQLRTEFGTVEKTGKPKEGPQFGFVEARVLLDKLVKEMGALGLTMLPIYGELVDVRESASKKQNVYSVKMSFQVTDVETGEFLSVTGFGSGADNSDKGLPKAQTNAAKYAALLLLQAVGDDPEADAGANDAPVEHDLRKSSPKASDGLKAKVRATAREKGLEDAQLKLLGQHLTGKESSTEWTTSDADLVLSTLQDPDKAGTVGMFAEAQA